MNEILLRATAKRDQLRKEVARLDEFIAQYNVFEREANKPKKTSPKRKTTKKRSGISGAHILDMSKQIMLANNNIVMQRSDILKELHARGLFLPSIDEQKYLGLILWRARDQIEHVPGQGYCLRMKSNGNGLAVS